MQWHATPPDELLRQLAVDPVRGLSREEAVGRLVSHGPNELRVEEGPSAGRILLGQFKNVLVIILLIATGLSALVGELFDAGLILMIVLFSAGLGFLQEYRAERAIEALKQMLSPTVSVLRDAEVIEIPAREVVPGDVLVLEAGDRVPSDARVVASHTVRIDEAALTGESIPAEKKPGVVPVTARTAERHNMVFMGTVVVRGRGRAVVVATGMQTEFGRVAQDVAAGSEEKTPLERRTGEIGAWLGATCLGIVLLVVTVGVLRATSSGTGLSLELGIRLAMFAIALAVAAVPEALPGIVTGTLALGMRRMAKQNALVRRMPAVEALGSITVICSDKTGTITKGEMTVRRIYSGGELVEVAGVGYEPTGDFSGAAAPQTLSLLFAGGALCNDAQLKEEGDTWRVYGDPTEGALVVLAVKAGISVDQIRLDYPRTDEIPFSSERKRMTTVHTAPDRATVAFMKGAPDAVLARCVSEWRAAEPVTLDETGRKAVLDRADEMAADGLRVLAVATRTVDSTTPELESRMTLLGLVAMIDPARQESIEAVQACQAIGIRPVMITGDHMLTAVAVARETGIFREGDRALTGSALEGLPDEEFERIVSTVSVYARVSPADKLRIVRAWKKQGQIVAMTGDGVNDAPALKHADVGIAMGMTGTEVAKEAADMVLVDDNFATILTAIEMGRWIYDNIAKYLTYLLRANIVEVVVIGGVVLARGAESLPLLPAAILYINLVTDGLPAIALGFAPPEPDIMRRPPRDPHQSVFSVDVKAFMFLSVLLTPIFFWVFSGREDLVQARTDLFFLFVVVELAMALNLRSLRYSILTAPPHGWLVASVMGSLLLSVALVWLPSVRDAFGVAIPGIEDLGLVLAVAVFVFVSSELVKMGLRRRRPSASRP